MLNGNINTYLAEKRSLSPSILARRVRIVPHSTRWRTVCMRVELYGCPFHGKLIGSRSNESTSFSFAGGIISYATSPSTDRDRTYDGQLMSESDLRSSLFVDQFQVASENWSMA